MIHIFRKEIKKWTSIIWIFIISIPLGGLSYWIFRKPLPNEVKVASVNGSPIYLNEYNHELSKIQMRVEMIKNYARSQGFPAELFLSLEGLNNPQEMALKELVNEKLLDKIHNSLGLELEHSYYISELGKSIPAALLDKYGRVNERFYRDYLRRLYLSVDEFESLKENEFKRQIIVDFVSNSFYIPEQTVLEDFIKHHSKKSFSILKVAFDHFLEESKQNGVTDDALKKYFEDHRESYRLAENRKAEYWVIGKDDYEKSINIDDESVEAFYEKNKNSMFRISPQVKVRQIIFPAAEKEKATSILEQLKKAPKSFADLAKKHSSDKKTSELGGLVDLFGKGTYSNAFETAAFRLKDVGEISDIVEDGKNLVIIQLVDRKPAEFKPLESVQNDIIKILKEKRALSKLRSDLEILMREEKTNPKAIDEFASKHNLQSKISSWLSEELAKGNTLQSNLAQKIFAKSKAEANFGYFSFEGSNVIFREVERKESFVPPFDKIKSVVQADYYKFNAQKSIKAFAKKVKAELLDNKTSLDQLSKDLSSQIIKTGMISSIDKVSSLENVNGLVSRAFDLTAKTQILKFKNMPDYYLVQLEKIGEIDMKEFEKEKEQIINEQLKSKKSLYLGAFIASLVRNARIDNYENSLKTAMRVSPVDYSDLD